MTDPAFDPGDYPEVDPSDLTFTPLTPEARDVPVVCDACGDAQPANEMACVADGFDAAHKDDEFIGVTNVSRQYYCSQRCAVVAKVQKALDASDLSGAVVGTLGPDGLDLVDGPDSGLRGLLARAADSPPPCYECGEALTDEWREAANEADSPPDCPECGENPLPPVGEGDDSGEDLDDNAVSIDIQDTEEAADE